MNIAVIGAGSLGMLLAGKISQVQPLSLVITHKESQAQQLNENGLTVVRAYDGSDTAITCPIVSASFGEAGSSERLRQVVMDADWIFVMVKQQHLDDELLHFLSEVSVNQAKIVCFQNGIGHVGRLAEKIPIEQIYVAITTEGAKARNLTTVEHTGLGWIRYRRAFDIDETRKEEYLLENVLQKAGFKAYMSKELERHVWNKLIINSVINPLTAIHRIPNGELLQHPELLQVMKALFSQCLTVTRALNVEVDDDLWEQLITTCEKTATNQSSMLQDVLNGRRTEIDWINGSLLREAKNLGLSLSAHEKVYAQVKALEDHVKSKSW